MCFVFIAIAFILFLIFWGINIITYKSEYESPVSGSLNKMMADMNATMGGQPFVLYPKFRNFTFSILRKFIWASMIIFLMYQFGWTWLRFVVIATVVLTYTNYAGRKDIMKKSPKNYQESMRPILKASARTLYFDILMLLLVIIEKSFL